MGGCARAMGLGLGWGGMGDVGRRDVGRLGWGEGMELGMGR